MTFHYQYWFDLWAWALPLKVTIEPENNAFVVHILCFTFAAWWRKDPDRTYSCGVERGWECEECENDR